MSPSAEFTIYVEVVPPAHADPEPLLTALGKLAPLPIDAFNIATNPVAKPRMSALAFSSLVQRETGKPAVLHITTRDHNRLSLQSLLWGARALGIERVLVTTGDYPPAKDENPASMVADLTVFELIQLAVKDNFQTGVVYQPPAGKLAPSLDRLRRKRDLGASFVITQPFYDRRGADRLARAAEACQLPLLPGILPLRSYRHARFMHQRVAGIIIPRPLLIRLEDSPRPERTGLDNAREMIALARARFPGMCLMPPFQAYQMLFKLLDQESEQQG